MNQETNVWEQREADETALDQEQEGEPDQITTDNEMN